MPPTSPPGSGTEVIFKSLTNATVQRLRVEVRRGPDRGASWDLDAEPVRIGTSEGCDVRLSDGAVSGVHAELRRTSAGFQLRDLGSTNGSFVDGRRIESIYLDGRATVHVGHSELRVVPSGEDSPVELLADDRFGELVGRSVPMRAVFARLSRVARTDTTVLLTGETGTGKELAAAAVRDHSTRKDGPFVVVDCGALPANLIESELFGHERGAFTGADRARPGAFERAHGGTIFLDEIGELPLALQPALLGILERREARRVGGNRSVSVDVRVITATNRDLASEVTRGAFRADLYYRLAVLELRLPPLRERPEDVPLLVTHFISTLPGAPAALAPETLDELQAYPWPGNVRELRNVIERASLLAEAPKPGVGVSPGQGSPAAGLPAATSSEIDIDTPFKKQKTALVSRFERGYVEKLISECHGNIAHAARRAGIDRMYLYKLLSRYDIDPAESR